LFEARPALLTAAAIGKLFVDGLNTALEIIARSSYVPALPSSALFPEFRRCTPLKTRRGISAWKCRYG
jgi:hypothetical protein